MTRSDDTKPTSSDGATDSINGSAGISVKSTSTLTRTVMPVAWRVWCLGWAMPDVVMAPSREEAIAMFRRENANCAVIEAELGPRGGR